MESNTPANEKVKMDCVEIHIRPMELGDWPDVERIYQQGIDTNLATFERTCPAYEAFDASHTQHCRFVAEQAGAVIGWAALTPVSNRCVYRGVAEVSVYIEDGHRGQGVGKDLLRHLISCAEQAGYWTLQSGIMQDNTASICLHKACGFRMVGYRERIGQDHNGQWRNTVLMERRMGMEVKCSMPQRTVDIDFLYLDLSTCERCKATDSALLDALSALSGVFQLMSFKVNVNKVNIATRQLAEQYRFLSSPTIRVNGRDICAEVMESDCPDCGSICGGQVDCRVFMYDGKAYEQPPPAMIADGILRCLFGCLPEDFTPYSMPDNLNNLFLRRENMKKLSFYEPAMCCETGLCGVGVDPELLRISTVLNTLKKQGITVERFNLTGAPMAFIQNQAINAHLQAKGVEGLPAAVLDGEIVLAGRYPTNTEIAQWLNLSEECLAATSPEEDCCCLEEECCSPENTQSSTGDCCCSNDSCCQ